LVFLEGEEELGEEKNPEINISEEKIAVLN
jgi:hypothetical protein